MSEKIQRNQGINILLLETISFARFRENVANKKDRFILEIANEMYKSRSNASKLTYDSGFGKLFYDNIETNFLLDAFKEELEDVHSTSTFSKNQIGIFEPMLMYVASYYFRQRYFVVPKYNPPVEYSKVFQSVFREINMLESNEIEYINPFFPFCDQLEQAGIYYVLLKPKIIEEVLLDFNQTIIPKRNSEHSLDYLFIKDFLEKAMSQNLQILVQLTP